MTDVDREIKRLISYIRSCREANIDCTVTIDKRLTHGVLNALEEIQQYREINTEIKQIFDGQLGLIDVLKGYIEDIKRTHNGKNPRKIIALSDEDADKWESYKKIGTVEECREAVEKQTPKKPVLSNDNGRLRKCCPVCGCFFGPLSRSCPKCGQAIQWENENLEEMEDERN